MNSRQRLGESGRHPEIPSPHSGIRYFAEDDLLSIWNGRPAPHGGYDLVDDVLIVFYEAAGLPVGLELFDAAELLAPALMQRLSGGRRLTPEGLHIEYRPSDDALWLGDGQPAFNPTDIIPGTLTVFANRENTAPVQVKLCRAAQQLGPLLLRQPATPMPEFHQ